jgi:hypothetical protein
MCKFRPSQLHFPLAPWSKTRKRRTRATTGFFSITNKSDRILITYQCSATQVDDAACSKPASPEADGAETQVDDATHSEPASPEADGAEPQVDDATRSEPANPEPPADDAEPARKKQCVAEPPTVELENNHVTQSETEHSAIKKSIKLVVVDGDLAQIICIGPEAINWICLFLGIKEPDREAQLCTHFRKNKTCKELAKLLNLQDDCSWIRLITEANTVCPEANLEHMAGMRFPGGAVSFGTERHLGVVVDKLTLTATVASGGGP